MPYQPAGLPLTVGASTAAAQVTATSCHDLRLTTTNCRCRELSSDSNSDHPGKSLHSRRTMMVTLDDHRAPSTISNKT